MQIMTWPLARLGSRFGLLLEPHRRRVMHSALGRFLDEPLDLAVGLVEPDGTERVMPFTREGKLLYGCEQFERINSVTYRGSSERAGLLFELNIHSPFYPQNEQLCLLPAFYVELRVTWMKSVRWMKPVTKDDPLKKVRLFVRVKRGETKISTSEGRIDFEYDVPLEARYRRSGYEEEKVAEGIGEGVNRARVYERIQSLNEGAMPIEAADGGRGLSLELPVTEEGSGIKWRMVWAAHTSDAVMEVEGEAAKLRYLKYWSNVDEVMETAIGERDDHLAHSRRLEKLLEQAPLTRARWHMLVLGFQSYLSNTFWCETEGGREWFSVWEGSCLLHSTVDVEYNDSMLYFAMWPRLLKLSLESWAGYVEAHASSGGVVMAHDMGLGLTVDGQKYPHAMPVEENANYLLLMQAYAYWMGDAEILSERRELVRKLADYLLWTDQDDSGFPSEGVANTIDDAQPAMQYSRKQTYLAIKRVMALAAAGDMLQKAGDTEGAEKCRYEVSTAAPKIESAAWLGDHFAVSVDSDAAGVVDVWTGKLLPYGKLSGWDDYSIYTTNGLLLPTMIGKQHPFDRDRMNDDVVNSIRETLTPYGCAHSSSDLMNIWISQNMWRDHAGRYLGAVVPPLESRYWDLEVFSNMGDQSFGYIDTYLGNELCFYPRGATAFGYLLSGPRLRIDRLSENGPHISITPDRYRHSRWPLLALADWKAGKIPVCVVDSVGNITIEGELEPVTIKTK